MPVAAEEIAYCHACGSPMDVTAMGPFANVECPGCGKHTRVKREFGPYTLLRRHAIGGMSVVFVAHDNTLDREVAVKILNEVYSADARRIAAFEEEARLTASFSHPHVVRVFTTGRAFGRFFIAMEFVVGGHFEQQISERGTIPEREMLQLAIQVAEGLRAAHNAGLIHRDIKPGNILLDGDGQAKIVDFGLALLLGKGGTAQAKEIWATPYYVPPETIESHPEDFRSDMYAFGATVYHALAGKPPCDEESMATVILREAKRKVVPLQTSAPWVSPQTCRAVDRAMAYDPAKRFQSYDEMLAHLNDALKNLRAGSTPLRRVPVAAKNRRHSAQHRELRLLFIGVGVAAAVALVALSGWGIRNHFKHPEKSMPAGGKITSSAASAASLTDAAAAATRISNLYRQARSTLEAGDYDKARGIFASLRDDGQVQEPTRTWAGVEAVLMSYLDGKSGLARQEAKATASHLANARLEDPSIKRLLMPVLGKLSDLPVIAAADTNLVDGGVPAAMAWLLAGLKDWEQGNLTEAARFFSAVNSANLDQQAPWVLIYQKISADYLADFKTFSNPVFDHPPKGKAACEDAINQLNDLLPSLKTRGRARFNIMAWKLDLERLARLPDPSEPSEPSDKTEPPDPPDKTEPPDPPDKTDPPDKPDKPE